MFCEGAKDKKNAKKETKVAYAINNKRHEAWVPIKGAPSRTCV